LGRGKRRRGFFGGRPSLSCLDGGLFGEYMCCAIILISFAA
jgi:hypothetical protein